MIDTRSLQEIDKDRCRHRQGIDAIDDKISIWSIPGVSYFKKSINVDIDTDRASIWSISTRYKIIGMIDISIQDVDMTDIDTGYRYYLQYIDINTEPIYRHRHGTSTSSTRKLLALFRGKWYGTVYHSSLVPFPLRAGAAVHIFFCFLPSTLFLWPVLWPGDRFWRKWPIHSSVRRTPVQHPRQHIKAGVLNKRRAARPWKELSMTRFQKYTMRVPPHAILSRISARNSPHAPHGIL